MPSDIDIAQSAVLTQIQTIAERLAIPYEAIDPYGHYKAKISLDYLDSLPKREKAHLILVTAISPTPRARARPPQQSASVTVFVASARTR